MNLYLFSYVERAELTALSESVQASNWRGLSAARCGARWLSSETLDHINQESLCQRRNRQPQCWRRLVGRPQSLRHEYGTNRERDNTCPSAVPAAPPETDAAK